MLDFYGNVKIMRNVSRRMFTPMPNVDSSVVKIDIVKNKYSCDKEMFSNIVHAGFSMRRKTLVNNLSSSLNLDKQTVTNWLAKCNLDATVRAESLSTEDYVNLTNAYFDIIRQN